MFTARRTSSRYICEAWIMRVGEAIWKFTDKVSKIVNWRSALIPRVAVFALNLLWVPWRPPTTAANLALSIRAADLRSGWVWSGPTTYDTGNHYYRRAASDRTP